MFCNGAKSKIKDLIRKFEDKALMNALELALNTTTQLKEFLNKDAVIRVVELTQWQEDDKVRQQMLVVIDQAIINLIGAKACRQMPDMDKRLDCYRMHINRMAQPEQLDELRKLAVEIVRLVHGAIERKSFYNAAFEVFYLIWGKK